MRKRILFVLMLLFTLIFIQNVNSSSSLGEIYSIETIIYRNGSANLESIKYGKGHTSHFTDYSTGYKMIVTSEKGTVLFSENFYASFDVTDVPSSSLKSMTKDFRIPYFNDATRIRIFYNNNVILDIDLRDSFCNKNSVCDKGESKYNCPEDCPGEYVITSTTTTSGEPVSECGDGICNEDEDRMNCPQDCETDFPYYLLWLVVIVVIIVISGMIIYESRKVPGENHE